MTFKDKEQALVQKAEQEFEYIADPANCGKIVRGNFDGIIVGLSVFAVVLLLAAMAGIYLYVHHR